MFFRLFGTLLRTVRLQSNDEMRTSQNMARVLSCEPLGSADLGATLPYRGFSFFIYGSEGLTNLPLPYGVHYRVCSDVQAVRLGTAAMATNAAAVQADQGREARDHGFIRRGHADRRSRILADS